MKKIIYFCIICLLSVSFSFANKLNENKGKKENKNKNQKVEETIVVTCDIKQEKVFKAEKSVNYIDFKDLKLTAPSSLSNVFERTAGVTSSSTGNSSVRPVVRGLYDERVLMMVNGIRQEEQFGGGNHTYSIAPEFINSVSVLKGSSSVTFGSDAIGGVINMFLNGYGEDRIPSNFFSAFYQTATNGNKQHFFYSKNFNDLSVYFEGLNKDMGNITTPDGTLRNSYAKGYFYNTGLNYSKDKWSYKLNFYGMQADLGIPVNPVAIDMGFKNNEYKRMQGEIDYSPSVSNWTGVKIIFANQFKHRHMYMELPYNNQFSRVNEIFLNKTSRNVRIFSDFLFGSNLLTVGFDGFREEAWSYKRKGLKSLETSEYNPQTIPGVIPPSKRYGWGIFAREEHDFNEKLSGFLAARYDWIKADAKDNSDYYYSGVTDTDKKSNFSTGFLYQLTNNQVFYLNAGTSFRSPSLLERFFYGAHQDSVNIGNPHLNPERGKSVDLGYRFKREKVDFSIGVFRTAIDNFIELANTGEIDSNSGLEIWKWLNLSKVVLKGGEFEVHYHFTDSLSYKINLSYVIAKDVHTDSYLYEIPPVIINNILDYSGERDGIKYNFKFVAHSECRQDRVAQFEKPTPGFTVYNFYSDFMFSKHLRFNLSVTNITDKSYHSHLSRIRYMNEGMGRSFNFELSYVF
ncbi:hemoglobin/transferrin/lactoferrin receptor protein [Thermotomaculum hydrothermale]|uniref:Hemoglobin/transferrin/lactoferrin receptor protein n=1 Tax=Thermotomaculum hydrothermale TaxID=981385 RepID=A0A7R6PG60_9BACT|nr:TonB-dependent receptor [Thermotomaculum hydrothermale]BBB33138.1 hemoglobin/transferrin/lactoferrin receptor protein [Thermotomaculum hydrothermale]